MHVVTLTAQEPAKWFGGTITCRESRKHKDGMAVAAAEHAKKW